MRILCIGPILKFLLAKNRSCLSRYGRINLLSLCLLNFMNIMRVIVLRIKKMASNKSSKYNDDSQIDKQIHIYIQKLPTKIMQKPTSPNLYSSIIHHSQPYPTLPPQHTPQPYPIQTQMSLHSRIEQIRHLYNKQLKTCIIHNLKSLSISYPTIKNQYQHLQHALNNLISECITNLQENYSDVMNVTTKMIYAIQYKDYYCEIGEICGRERMRREIGKVRGQLESMKINQTKLIGIIQSMTKDKERQSVMYQSNRNLAKCRSQNIVGIRELVSGRKQAQRQQNMSQYYTNNINNESNTDNFNKQSEFNSFGSQYSYSIMDESIVTESMNKLKLRQAEQPFKSRNTLAKRKPIDYSESTYDSQNQLDCNKVYIKKLYSKNATPKGSQAAPKIQYDLRTKDVRVHAREQASDHDIEHRLNFMINKLNH